MKITSKYYKIFLSMLITLWILITPTAFAATEEDYTKFDLREHISIPVQDQKSTQYCWTFASNTVLQTNLLLTKKETFDFSERHMEYATSKTFSDGINNLAHNREVNSGGNERVAMAYYTSGRGPVLETEMPFSISQNPIALAEIEGKTVQKKITDYIAFPEILKTKDETGNITYTNNAKNITYTETEVEVNRTKIKEHIMQYGAVTAMTVSGTAYSEYYNYNMEYPAFYCDNSSLTLNHQITIIGWDDNYEITNFNEQHRPSKPGAYLVLTSYGTNGNYPNGCYYVSYEDAFIEISVLGVINIENIDYDKIYQYDPLGLVNNITYGNNETLYGANVFSKNAKEIEQINEISIAAHLEQDVEVYINAQDGDLTKVQKVEIEQTKIRQGYTTIKLKNPVKLTGDKFVVAVKYINKGKKAGIGVEIASTGYWTTATSNAGESYFSTDMTKWTDLVNAGVSNTNICIKAFTTRVIESEQYEIENDIIYKISQKTTVKDFKAKMNLVEDDKIFKDNIELTENEFVKTNSVLRTSNNKTYTLVVTGDTKGRGQIDMLDVAGVQLHYVGLEQLTGVYLKAADTNFDSKIDMLDVARVLLVHVGLMSL